MNKTDKPGQLEEENRVKSFYGPDKVEEGFELALLGLTDKDMSKVWGLSPQTVISWKAKYPEFGEAVRKGRTIADGKMAASLYKRAIGFYIEEEKVNVIKGEAVITKIKKYIPPDVEAIKYMLGVRERERGWGMKDNINSMNVNITQINLGDIAEEDLLAIRKMQMKYLAPPQLNMDN